MHTTLALLSALVAGALAACPRTDMMLIFDSSQSITSVEYQQMKSYAKSFVSVYNVAPNADNIGFVIFNENIRESTPLSMHTDLASLQSAIMSMGYYTGTTNVNVALNNMHSSLFSSGRPGVCKVVVLFTDGRFNEDKQDPVELAKQLRQMGATILAVAVEGVNGYLSPYDRDILVQITGDPNNVMIMHNSLFEEQFVAMKAIVDAA